MVPCRVMKTAKFEADLFPTRVVGYDLNGVVDREYITTLLWSITTSTGLVPHKNVINGITNFRKTGSLLDDNRLSDLRDILTDRANDYCSSVGFPKVETVHSWCNFARQGTELKNHNHPITVCVAAYYSSVEEGSCNLHFSNNDLENFKYHHPSYHTPESDNFTNLDDTPYNQFNYELELQSGWVYFFPGYLHHWSPKNNSEERVVLAANFNTVGNRVPGTCPA